jgi:hypothetical protein
VVFQTASTMYVERGGMDRIRAALDEAAHEEPVVYVGTGRSPGDEGFALDVERYPGGELVRLGVFDFHGEWLDWGA